jgi:hypothetical protein
MRRRTGTLRRTGSFSFRYSIVQCSVVDLDTQKFGTFAGSGLGFGSGSGTGLKPIRSTKNFKLDYHP